MRLTAPGAISVRDRQLQLEGECTTIKALNTTYNSDDRVPPYVGVMFEIFPRMDLELLTLQLDVRIPPEEQNSDLSVEVYTMKGSYQAVEAYSYDPSQWHLLTQTVGVLFPEGQGLVIPTKDFNTLHITSGEKRSFYVTMKRPYIDHNVMALQKTGELQMQSEELDIYVGVGFNEYKFPGDYDRTIDPQFAGVMHFRKTTECIAAVVTTTVMFPFLLDQEATPQLVASINQYIDDAIKALMKQNSALKSYQKFYGLQQYQETTTSAEPFDGK
jgi:hypothetical protein